MGQKKNKIYEGFEEVEEILSRHHSCQIDQALNR